MLLDDGATVGAQMDPRRPNLVNNTRRQAVAGTPWELVQREGRESAMTQNDVLPVAAHARGAQAEGAPARAARALGRAAVPAALIAPAAVAAALVPFRDVIANIDAALVLVLVVVAVATAGNRAAGALAALSAGVWFDFFLTRPYERLTINDRADVETTVLLLAVGVAVTELAIWGRRQQALAARQGGHLSRIQDAAESVAARTSSGSVIEQVRE